MKFLKYLGVFLIIAGIGGIISNEIPLGLLFVALGFVLAFNERLIKKAENTYINKKYETESIPYAAKPDKKTITFRVAGVTKKNDEGKDIQKLLAELAKDELMHSEPYGGLTYKEILEDYPSGEKVYELLDADFLEEIEFEFEPDNLYDPNAIKVIHEYIGHIGYVPREDNVKVGKIIREKEYEISWKLVGGKYKYVDEEDKVRTGKDNYGVLIELSYKE